MGPGSRRRLPDCLEEMGEGRRWRHLAEELRPIAGRGDRLARGGRMGYTEDVEYFSGYHFCDTLLDLASTRTAPHRTANCCSLEPCWAPIPPFFSSIRIYAFVGVCTTQGRRTIAVSWADAGQAFGCCRTESITFLGRENGCLFCEVDSRTCLMFLPFNPDREGFVLTRVGILNAWVRDLCTPSAHLPPII
jgi:hypothetical protein